MSDDLKELSISPEPGFFREASGREVWKSLSGDPVYAQVDTYRLSLDLKKVIAGLDGPIVEVGGPTQTSYGRILGDIKLPSKPLVSNIAFPRETYLTYNVQGEPPSLDLLADAENLPFADRSTAMLLAAALPKRVLPYLLRESKRILRDNGMLVLKTFRSEDLFDLAIENSFEPVKVNIHTRKSLSTGGSSRSFDAIFLIRRGSTHQEIGKRLQLIHRLLSIGKQG